MKNKLCVCESGKEQKNCCKKCIQVILSKKDVHGNITEEKPYWITFAALPSNLSHTDHEEANRAIKFIKNDPQTAIGILQNLQKKYPNNCTISHNLACAYLRVNREQEAYDLFEKNYKEHPEYIFSRAMLGKHYLDQKKLEKIPPLLENKKDLKELYPQRNVFHVSEMKTFCSLLGFFYCELERINEAQVYLDAIRRIAPKSEAVEELEDKIALTQLFLKLKSKAEHIKQLIGQK